MSKRSPAPDDKFITGLIVAGVGLWVCYLGYQVMRHVQSIAPEIQSENSQTLARQMAAIFRPDATLDEIYLGCAERWRETNPSIYQIPIAMAWRRDSLDAYFYAGTDATSVRHVRCDASGVSLGERYRRPLLERTTPEALNDHPSQPLALPKLLENSQGGALTEDSTWHASWHAIETLHDPKTDEVITRLWFGNELNFQTSPASAPEFPLLMQPTVNAALPSLVKLVATRWNEQPSQAFNLLARELPADAKIVELTLSADKIDVQIAGPIPAFDGDPPAPFGEKNFDAYGIADMSFWYPREIAGFGCTQGKTLAEVVEGFRAARGRDGVNYYRAWYSCSTAYGDGKNGQWSLAY